MPVLPYSAHSPIVSQPRAHIFRLAPTRVSQRKLITLARRFGLKGNLKTGGLCQDARQMSYREGSFELVLHHASGGLRYRDHAKWQVDDGVANVAHDDATAIAMAARFSEQLSLVSIAETRVLQVTRLKVGVVERRTGLAEVRAIDVGVAFGRVVEGIPVEGSGGKVIVYIDHKGELTGIDRLWREIEAVHARDVALRPAEAVQQEALLDWGEAGSGSIAIDHSQFGYYEDGWDMAQRYLQPAYFVGLAISAAGHCAGSSVLRSAYWGAAASESPEPVLPARRVVRPQARRSAYSERP